MYIYLGQHAKVGWIFVCEKIPCLLDVNKHDEEGFFHFVGKYNSHSCKKLKKVNIFLFFGKNIIHMWGKIHEK
jgi:hypothetical protein